MRKKLIEMLEVYMPDDKNQRQAKEKILTFVMEYPNCFQRTNLDGHVTGSCFLVSPDNSKVLLTHHKKIGKWLQLGGHADGDHDLLRVALREAHEESGIIGLEPLAQGIFDVDIHAIEEYRGVPAHFHYDIRFLLKADTTLYRVSNESHDLAWVPIEDLASDGNNASLFRMATKWLAR